MNDWIKADIQPADFYDDTHGLKGYDAHTGKYVVIYQAKLMHATGQQRPPKILTFTTVKELLSFTSFYLKKFSPEYKTRVYYHVLCTNCGAYMQDSMYNEYWLKRFTF